VKLGVFDHLDRGTAPLSAHYEDRLKLIEGYDRAGFHAYHVAAHHATPLGMAPSPNLLLAAIAQARGFGIAGDPGMVRDFLLADLKVAGCRQLLALA